MSAVMVAIRHECSHGVHTYMIRRPIARASVTLTLTLTLTWKPQALVDTLERSEC